MPLDPSTGATILADPDLARMLDRELVRRERMRFEVETATRVCTTLDDRAASWSGMSRRRGISAAASQG